MRTRRVASGAGCRRSARRTRGLEPGEPIRSPELPPTRGVRRRPRGARELADLFEDGRAALHGERREHLDERVAGEERQLRLGREAELRGARRAAPLVLRAALEVAALAETRAVSRARRPFGGFLVSRWRERREARSVRGGSVRGGVCVRLDRLCSARSLYHNASRSIALARCARARHTRLAERAVRVAARVRRERLELGCAVLELVEPLRARGRGLH